MNDMAGIADIFRRDTAALAPLAGVNDSVFRRICAEFGARPVLTEMLSSDGLVRGNMDKAATRMLRFGDDERPIGYQLFGSDPYIMGEAARRLSVRRPDFIDINAGCPVKKVISHDAGSALMKKPRLLGDIVAATVKGSSVPVTVKIRSGWDHDSINAVEVARVCESEGAQAVIVHPRTRSQGFSGTADWSVIAAVKDAVSVPVIGSGDINTHEDAAAMLELTGADGIIIGRRAMHDPWVFERVNARLRGESVPGEPSVGERLDLALRQLGELAVEVSERFAVLNMRKFFGWYSKGAVGGAEFRRQVFRAESIDGVTKIVREFQELSREKEVEEVM